MPDNRIDAFLLFMTGRIPDQLSLGALRWFTVALYWVLLAASLAVAVHDWRRDPAQRTGTRLSIYGMRPVAAGVWYLGTLWKLPLSVSAGFKFWLDRTVKFSSFHLHAAFMRVFAVHVALVQVLVYLLEVVFTASLMLGFMARRSGVLAALFTLNLLIGLYNDPVERPWTYVGIICAHGMFAATQAGRSLGLDNLVAHRLLSSFRYEGAPSRALRRAA